MKLKASLAVCSAAMLAACGGGSSGTSNNPTIQPTVLKTFTDGAGVARVSLTQNNLPMTFNVMGADIQNYSVDPTAVADISNMTYTSSNQYGDLYSGPVTSNGVTINAIAFVDSSSGAVVVYGQNAYANALAVGGETVSNIPSGVFTYNGTNFIGYRDGSYFEDGTFAMGVDFSNGTGNITGNTPNSTMGGTISVNASNGTFSGNNLALTDTFNNLSTTGSINGNFHNAGATGVSGIYYDNGPNPVVAGAIVGSR